MSALGKGEMSELLSVLRRTTMNGSSIHEEDDHIVLGNKKYGKHLVTSCVMTQSKNGSAKQYYTLECLVYFLRMSSLPHSEYARKAMEDGVPYVRFSDRKHLLAYFNGKTSKAKNIDRITSQGSLEECEPPKNEACPASQQRGPSTGPCSNHNWQECVTKAVRDDVLEKFAKGVFPVNIRDQLDEAEMETLMAYCKIMEDKIFSEANSRSEYFHLLCEKIQKILDELDTAGDIVDPVSLWIKLVNDEDVVKSETSKSKGKKKDKKNRKK